MASSDSKRRYCLSRVRITGVETFEAAEAAGNQNFGTLLDFSLGRSDDRAAMPLPHPRPAPSRRRAQQAIPSTRTPALWS